MLFRSKGDGGKGIDLPKGMGCTIFRPGRQGLSQQRLLAREAGIVRNITAEIGATVPTGTSLLEILDA